MKIFLLLATTFCVSGISAAVVPKIESEEQNAAIGKKPQQQQATPAAIARRQLPFSSSLAVTITDSRTLNLNYTTISTTASPVITTTATAEAEAEAVANPAGLLKSFLPLPPLLPLPPSPTKCTPSSICVDKISICADFSRKRYGGYVNLSYFTLLFSPFFSRLLLLFVSPVCSFFSPFLLVLFFFYKSPPLSPRKKGGKKKEKSSSKHSDISFFSPTPTPTHQIPTKPTHSPPPPPPPQHHADTTTITIIIIITTIIHVCIDARIIYEWNGMS